MDFGAPIGYRVVDRRYCCGGVVVEWWLILNMTIMRRRLRYERCEIERRRIRIRARMKEEDVNEMKKDRGGHCIRGGVVWWSHPSNYH